MLAAAAEGFSPLLSLPCCGEGCTRAVEMLSGGIHPCPHRKAPRECDSQRDEALLPKNNEAPRERATSAPTKRRPPRTEAGKVGEEKAGPSTACAGTCFVGARIAENFQTTVSLG